MVDKLPNLHVVFLSPETEEGQRHEHGEIIPEQKYLETDQCWDCHEVVERVIIDQIRQVEWVGFEV